MVTSDVSWVTATHSPVMGVFVACVYVTVVCVCVCVVDTATSTHVHTLAYIHKEGDEEKATGIHSK